MPCSFPSSLDFARAAVPFLKALPRYLRTCKDDPSLRYYNTGESGHWAVQSNQQVAGALACLAENPAILAAAGAEQSADELRELALSMLRYSMRTHVSGDLKCTDGQQWGRHWISVLGLERATPGLSLLRRHCFTPEDEERFRALVAAECDYRMSEYEVQAALEASTGRNKPESNIWNGAFLLRAAAMEEEISHRGTKAQRGDEKSLCVSVSPCDQNPASVLSRGTQFLLNGLSFPEDATNDAPVLGKPVREWHVGANFFSDGALDHHGYLNVGYINVCLSNLALAWFWYRERGLPVPEALLHNARRVWDVAKRFTFPDGRLLRLGGDSRARYTYCQAFALQGWHLAWALWGDEDAALFARGYLGIIAQEQAENPDGTFYGKRLAGIRAETPWWETRLECDPFTVLCTSAYWAKIEEDNSHKGTETQSVNNPTLCDSAPLCIQNIELWRGAFHGAALLRTPVAVRSAVARAFAGPTRANARNFHETGPAALCVPTGRSDMAEWSGNLFAFVGLRGPKHDGKATIEKTTNGFRWRWEGIVIEDNPLGEGESPYPVLRRRCTAEALPDGKTLRLSDRIECIKETTLPAGFRALHLQIPNDIYNDHHRRYTGDGGFSFEACSYPSSPSLIETDSVTLTIDGVLTVRSLDGKPLCIRRPAGQGALCYNGLTSQYIEEVCTDCREDSVHLMPGDILCDERYEVQVLQ